MVQWFDHSRRLWVRAGGARRLRMKVPEVLRKVACPVDDLGKRALQRSSMIRCPGRCGPSRASNRWRTSRSRASCSRSSTTRLSLKGGRECGYLLWPLCPMAAALRWL